MTKETILNFGQGEELIFRIKPIDESVLLTITDTSKKRRSEISFNLTSLELQDFVSELKEFL